MKFAEWMCTDAVLDARAVMAIDAVIHVTILTICARVEACQELDGSYLILIWRVIVLEAACVTLGAGASQIMVVAEFVASGSLLDDVEYILIQRDGLI